MIAVARPGTVLLDADDADYLARALAMLPPLLTETRRTPAPRLLAVIAAFTKTSAAAVDSARNAIRTDSGGPGCASTPPDPGEPEPYASTVDTATAARILGISPSAVRQLAQRGRLPARRPAGRWLYDAAAVVARAERCRPPG